jgi:hypothetical protein
MNMVSQIEPWRKTARITGETMLCDLFREYPNARAVLDRHKLSDCGDGDGPAESIAFMARMHHVPEEQLIREFTEAATETEPAPAAQTETPAPSPPPVAVEAIYRRFFIGAICITLSAGATWGAFLLWQIAIAKRFTGVSLHVINAHGSAQIFGWVGLFIMGFAYQAFPRLWQTRLAWPRACGPALLLTLIAVAITTLGVSIAAGSKLAAPLVVVSGGALHVIATTLFAIQMIATFRRSPAKLEPYVGFIFASLFWFVAMSLLNAWHTWTTTTARDLAVMLWHVATYQAPLRDMQIHGMALCMILGVSIRMFPAMFGLPQTPAKRAWIALALLTSAVAGECIIFVAYRWSGWHVIAAFLMVPWIMLVIGCAMIALPWKLWRPMPVSDRSAKFVRAAYAWLAISLLMLLALPAYMKAVHIPFSHAFYGAIRHSITVGFVSLMIMGVAWKVVPMLNGIDPRRLSPLWGPFLLANVGCTLRVLSQSLTDIYPEAFKIIGFSGVLEVIALTWWSIAMLGLLLRQRGASVAEPSRRTGVPRLFAAGQSGGTPHAGAHGHPAPGRHHARRQ